MKCNFFTLFILTLAHIFTQGVKMDLKKYDNGSLCKMSYEPKTILIYIKLKVTNHFEHRQYEKQIAEFLIAMNFL